MSLFNLRQTMAPRANAINLDTLTESLKNNNEAIFDKDKGAMYVGLESEYKVTEDVATTLTNHFDDVKRDLGLALAGIGEAGLESAARAAIMLGDIDGVSAKISELGLESFSKTALKNYRDETIAANAMTAEQTSILDVLYPIVEVGANYGGVKIELTRFTSVSNVVNPGDGSVMDFGRRHLVEGYRDATALKGAGNVLYPIVVTGENEDEFIDAALYPASTVENTEMKTAPLKPRTSPINLLGLAKIPGADASSRHTYNDRIDEGGSLRNLYIQIGEDKTGSGGSDERKVIPVSLAMYNSAQFLVGSTGEHSDAHANLDAQDLPINLASTAAQATPALKALADAQYVRVTLGIQVNSKLNLHNGNFSQTFSGVTVTGLYKANDSKNYVGEAPLAAEIAALAPVFAGQDFNLTISSKTIRLEGLRVDDQTLPFTYHVGARNVITADRAIDEADTSSALQTMSAAEVIEREAAAVRRTLSVIDDLDAAYGDGGHGVAPAGHSMAGLSYIGTPWVQVENLTLADIVDTQKSSERFADISSALVHLLSDRATDAMTKTIYLESKRLYTGDKQAKAKFAILTQRAIGRYLYTEGDDRTFGALEDIDSKPRIVTTSLDVMDDTIIMVMASTASAGAFDPFAWGNTLRSPSVVYEVSLTKDGGAKKHLQLQPFYEFVNNMPIVYKLKVDGLSEFLKSKAPQLTKTVA